MKSLIAILLVGYGSWHYIDLSASSGFNSIFAPMVFIITLIAACLWLVLVGGVTGRVSNQTYFTSSSSGHFGDDGGGGGGD